MHYKENVCREDKNYAKLTLIQPWIERVSAYADHRQVHGMKNTHHMERPLTRGCFDEWLLRGSEYFHAQHYREALEAFDRAVVLDDGSVQDSFFATIYKSLTCMFLSRFDEAMLACEQGCQRLPIHHLLLEYTVDLLLTLRQWGNLLGLYEQLLRIRFTFDTLFCKGLVLYLLGRSQEALRTQEHFFAVLPDPSRCPSFQEKSLQHLLLYQEWMLEMVSLYNDAHAWYYTGMVLWARAEPESDVLDLAIIAFAQAQVFAREKQIAALAFNMRGNIFLQRGQSREAIEAYDKAIMLHPKRAAFHLNRYTALRRDKGRAFLYRKQKQRRMSFFQRYPWVRKTLSLPEHLLGWEEGEYEEQLVACDSFLGATDSVSTHERSWVLFLKIEGLYAVWRWSDMLHAFRDLLSVPPHLPVEAWEDLDDMLFRMKAYDLALVAVDHALQIDERSDLIARQGALLTLLGQYEKALIAYTKASQLDPFNIRFRVCRASTFVTLARHSEALTAFDAALQLDPLSRHTPFILLRKADICLECADPYQALSLYDDAYCQESMWREQPINEDSLFYENCGFNKPDLCALILVGKGNAWYQLKDYRLALDAYEQALSLSPDAAIKLKRSQMLMEWQLMEMLHVVARPVSSFASNSGQRNKIMCSFVQSGVRWFTKKR